MASNYRIPVWSTVGQSYRLAYRNGGEFVRVAKWWLLIALVVLTAYNHLIWGEAAPLLCFTFIGHPPDPATMYRMELRAIIAVLPVSFFYLFISASIAVAWHRLILRGERIATDCYLRWDRIVACYFGYGVLLMVIQKTPSLINITVATLDSNGLRLLCSLAGIVLSIFTLLFFFRVTPILPAVALGMPLTLKEVWNRTRSNFWRLFLGTFACALPGCLIIMIFLIFIVPSDSCLESATGPMLYSAANIVSLALLLPVVLSYISLSYQYFFEQPEPPAAG